LADITFRSRILGSSILGGVAFLSATALAVTPAAAQDATAAAAANAQTAGELDEVVVTGSRIARKDYLANSPIVTVTQDDVRATGSANIETLINELPQFTPLGSASSNSPNLAGQAQVQLRGLGAIRTLVLLNGRRVVPSSASSVVDLNLLPTPLISSVETITGGASSTYGSDAVAGVLNFRLNENFEGVQLDVQYGVSDRGDAESEVYSVTMGGDIAEGRGNAVLSLSYSDRDSVLNAAREFSRISGFAGTSPLGSTVFDANNLPSAAAVSAAVPGAARGNTFGFNNNGTLFAYQGAREYISPGGLDYEGFRMPGPLQQTDFTYTTGDRNYMIIPQQRYNIYGAANYEITAFAEAYADFLFSQYEAGNQLASNPATGPTTGFRIPGTNPFIPAELRAVLNSRPNPNGSFRLDKRFNELGPRRQNETYDVYQITTGLRGRLPVRDWTYDAYLSYGRVDNGTTYTGYLSRSAVQRLLDAPDGGASICAGGFNPFGEKSLSAACIDYVSRVPKNTTTNDQRVAEINMQGGVFNLPAGEVRVALGATHREQNYDFVPDELMLATFTLNGTTGPELAGASGQPLSGSDKVREIYGEVLIPLLRDMPFVHSLETNLGYRLSNYDTIGRVSSYKADLSWEIVEGLRIRGGLQRAVRAPSINELFATQNLTFMNIGVPVSSAGVPQFSGDPCDIRGAYRAPGAANAAQVRALCLAQNVPGQVIDAYTFSNSQTPGLTGGNPLLEEETADSFTVGATWQSPFSNPWLSRLSGSIDYYDITIKDVVGTLATTEQLRRCFNQNGTSNPTYDPSNFFCQLFSRDPNSGQITNTLETNANLGTLKTSGIDFQIDWAVTLADVGGPEWGALALNVIGTKLQEWKRQDLPGGAFTDRKGTVSNTFGLTLPEWKFLSTLSWNYEPFSVGVRWRYQGEVENFNNREQVLSAVNYFDLNTTWKVNKTVTLRGGVNNLTDKQPPVYSPAIAANTDPSTYDLVGRRYYLGLTARF
jgi:iron complex outermembrane receptor protein